MTDVKFNVNYNVRVQLTETGIKELKKQHQAYLVTWKKKERDEPFEPPIVDEKGFSRWQLHNLMYVFGDLMYFGSEPPFKTAIIMEVE